MRLTDFLEPFYPDPQEPVFIRAFSPKEMPPDDKLPVFTVTPSREQLASDEEVQRQLREANQHQGMYYVVNAGGFRREQIEGCRAVFCEIDNKPLDKQRELYEHCALEPSIQVETKKSIHTYWLTDPVCDVETWNLVQCGLIHYFAADGGLKNENRLMRLPFFNHLSWNGGDFNRKKVSIIKFDPHLRYTPEILRHAFPFEKPKERIPDYPIDADTISVGEELRMRIAQLSSYHVEHDGVHATANGICHNGQGNTALMVNLKTGAVFCHSGCDFWHIARTFGLERPEHKGFVIKRRHRTPQTSETGKWLERYVRGRNEAGSN